MMRILLCALLAVVLTACGTGPRSSPAEQRDVVLDSAERPETLALSDDGSVWFTTEYSSAVTRLGPKGQLTEYPLPHEDEIPYDLVRGPDGAIYGPTDRAIERIERSGDIRSFDVGWALAITADDDGLWYTTFEPRVEHITTEGTVDATIALPAHDGYVDRRGIAAGPGGTVWLTEASTVEGPPDAIARVTADGSYARWPLPERRAGPLRIAAGPDGALWFTEQRAHRVGRITTDGEISEYPLPLEPAPTDIAAADGALWFTTDTCIGRVTTKGQISIWPVAGAKKLVRIAAAPDGGFWLADHSGHALRHFTPPEPPVAPADACHPPSIVLEVDAMRAVVSYKRLDMYEDGGDFFTDVRVRIAREGKEVFSEAVPDHAPGGYADRDYTVYGYSSDVGARDLDGDGEAELLLELNWNGTHCCSWSRIYRYDSRRATYVPSTHFWGDAVASPKLRDLDDDGRPEFLSADARFLYLFAAGYAGSMTPVQIWSYREGKFSDVTRHHPRAIEEDATKHWRWYLEHRGKDSVRYALAVWAADQYMLGRPEAVERALADALVRGDLKPRLESDDAESYLRKLRALLRKTGYARD